MFSKIDDRFASRREFPADAIDRALYGGRVLVVAVAALVTVLASALESWLPRGVVAKVWPQPDAPIVPALSTFGFTSLLMTLFIARLGSLRDDDGQWSVELIQRRAHELRIDVGEVFSAFGTMESAVRWKAFGRVTLFTGFLVLALRNIFKMYVSGWTQGPIILLLCDAASENAERYLRREIEDLRAKGSSVVLVFAVRAGRAGS